MSWLVDVAAVLGTGGFGAVVGLAGGWLAKKEARKMKELDNLHEENMQKYLVQESQEESRRVLALADKNIQLAETEGDLKLESKSIDAFTQSIKEQGKNSGIKWIDGIQRMVRPLITGWLLWELNGIRIELEELTKGLSLMPVEELTSMYMLIVNAIIFLSTTATGWWFASRRGQL